MYDMRLSTLRRYTCAALNGLGASTVPVRLAMSRIDALSRLCAVAPTLPLETRYPPTSTVTPAASTSARLRRTERFNMLKVPMFCSTGLTSEANEALGVPGTHSAHDDQADNAAIAGELTRNLRRAASR